jgi:hypothetical protein
MLLALLVVVGALGLGTFVGAAVARPVLWRMVSVDQISQVL